VFVGERIIDAPAMDKNLLAVALRAVDAGVAPGISIEPSPDPSVMKVRYLGQTENTRFGSIMFESDRMLKVLSLGKDNHTGEPFLSGVPGYQSITNRSNPTQRHSTGSSLYRLWFKPHRLVLKKTADGHALTFVESTMTCHWETIRGMSPGAAVQAFVQHVNSNFQAYTEEYPIFQDMLLLEKMVGLALWMRDHHLFLDPNKLGIDFLATPATTPATTVTRSMPVGKAVWHLTSIGGVDFAVANTYAPDTDGAATQLREAALRDRPRADSVSWDVAVKGQYLTAVAVPIVKQGVAR
jgi:hypothetical protein